MSNELTVEQFQLCSEDTQNMLQRLVAGLTGGQELSREEQLQVIQMDMAIGFKELVVSSSHKRRAPENQYDSNDYMASLKLDIEPAWQFVKQEAMNTPNPLEAYVKLKLRLQQMIVAKYDSMENFLSEQLYKAEQRDGIAAYGRFKI